jgi:STE24 endopeptidase
LKTRQSLGMVLPVAVVYGLGTDLIHRGWPSTATSSWDQPVGLIVMGVLVLIAAPALIRLAWPTHPLPPGPLRDRLERVANRVGFRCTDILVWDTSGVLVNAGVTGSLPWFRYVFLTDALIEELNPYEIAAVFGHEIGHIAHRHLVYFGFFILASLGVLALAGGAINQAILALPMPSTLVPGTTGSLILESALTLLVIGGYFFFVFGFLSRRFEGQADVFGCRVVSCGEFDCPPHADLDGPSAGTSSPSVKTTMPLPLCPVGIRIFINALENVAMRNGMKPRSWSWRHGSILRRINFLESLIETPGAERRFQTKVRRLRWVMAVVLVAGAGLAVVMAGG